MKHKIKILSLLLVGFALLLGGCSNGFLIGPGGNTGDTGDTGDGGTGTTGDDPNIDPTTEVEPGPEEDPNDDGGDDNPSGGDPEPDSDFDPEGTYTIDLYANGDQHGVINETRYNSYYNSPSFGKFVTYTKTQMSNCANPILISNGDLWQGSYESNFNYGNLLTDAINEAGYSCMTVGNHEFDWGQEVLKENAERSEIPFLAANIVYYGTDTLLEYTEPYTVVKTDCGLKVGVVGVIGTDQWSSITSTYVQDLEFTDPETAIKKYSDILRVDEGCEIVVASFHQGTSDSTTAIANCGKTSSVSGKPYIDAAFTSHDHSYTDGYSGGVPYANSGCNLADLSHIQLKYNAGDVSCTKCENLMTFTSKTGNYKEDEGVKAIADSYLTDDIVSKGQRVAGTLSGDFSRYGEAPNMMAEAMYNYAQACGYDVCLAMVNNGRADLTSGTVTYANLSSTFPFFNKTVIMEATGKDILSEAGYTYYYSANTTQTIENSTSKKYLIAVYDYLAYHMTTSSTSGRRYYNYFYYGFTVKAELETYPYDYLYDYMTSQSGTIKSTDYSSSVSNFNFLK